MSVPTSILRATAAAIAVLIVPGRSLHARPPCEPVAVLDGPPSIVEAIATLLTQHGVRVTPEPRCPGRTITARIEAHHDRTGFTLTTVDESGRTSARVFADARTAASLIESWALDDGDTLLAPPPSAALAADPLTPFADLQFAARVHVYGGPEASLGSDRSLWLGVALGACVRLGALCAGVRLRSARDADLTGASMPDTVFREDVDVLATVAGMMRASAFIITPTVAAGGGWLHTQTDGGPIRDALVINDRDLRLELDLQGRWPVSPRVALAAEVGVGWSPFARAHDTVDQGAVILGEPAEQVRLALSCVVTP